MKPNWQSAARSVEIWSDDIDEILSSDDEEYALYNFVFLCKEAFASGIDQQDWSPPRSVLAFIASCLSDEYSSETEDVPVAAGVGFAEHLFDDVQPESYARIHCAVGSDFYQLCRPWLKNWLEPDRFELVERGAQ